MNIRKIPALLLIAAIFIGVFTGCSYKVADEKNARKVYTCPKNNMFGLEKVVVFEDHVVVVLDKSICDSGCGGLSVKYHYEHSPSSVTLSNATMPVSAVDWDNSIQTVKGRYIVTTKFDISSIQKKDQDKDITVTGINIQGKNIKINGGEFRLSYSVYGGECTDDYDQSFTNGKWNNIHHDFTMYPMTALD